MDFGDKLIEIRKKRGLSQEKLGEIVDIDKRLISRYETGKNVPSIEVAKKFAVALSVSLDYLMGLGFSLFIDDPEMTKILKEYDKLSSDDKATTKKVLKALSFYSKIEETQNKLAI